MVVVVREHERLCSFVLALVACLRKSSRDGGAWLSPVQDELKIPLILETIPAPQEFRDAIESLSPEQQAFCKACRQMQLAGSLFAVAVVQIKPQLERLLKLDHDAITKEVKLCQGLLSLFIECVRWWFVWSINGR